MTIKVNEVMGSVNRGNPCDSGLCEQCRVDCKGKCETFLSAVKGRRMIYTQEKTGTVTYGSNNMNPVGISYNSLKIQGNVYGARGLKEGLPQNSDFCLSPYVDVSTEFGNEIKTKCKIPINMGAAINVVQDYWKSYAIAAALIGFTLVIGENVMNMDPGLVIENGKVIKAPKLDNMIEPFLNYYNGYGGIIVQVNFDDIYNNKETIDYVCEKYGDKVILEIKWGQGGKSINGEVITDNLERALTMRKRYPVYPDPLNEDVQRAYKEGKISRFTRLSKIPYTDLNSYEEVEKEFLDTILYIKEKGCHRISLKTAGFGMEGLAMAIKLSSKAGIDLVTIDGSGGGTAHSPWLMMEHWGIPSILVHSKAKEYGDILSKKGERVVDLSFGGGFAREDHLYKAIALGAPYCKTITMCRSMIIPGVVGSNIEGALYPERRASVHGNWDKLPESISQIGSTPEEIFECYKDVLGAVGSNEMKNIPFGTIAMWNYIDKIKTGLQQLMAGARSFSINTITRDDIVALNRETANETGVKYATEAQNETALKILNL